MERPIGRYSNGCGQKSKLVRLAISNFEVMSGAAFYSRGYFDGND